MPSYSDTVPNLSKDWEYRGLNRRRRPGSKVYGWTGGEPKDATWFALLFVAAVAVSLAVWLLIPVILQFLAGL